jgi:hypothetical protein
MASSLCRWSLLRLTQVSGQLISQTTPFREVTGLLMVLEIQKMRRLIIITDPSPLGDDAVAISLLAADRSLEIKLIVATSGNVWAEQAASNVFTLLARLCQ